MPTLRIPTLVSCGRRLKQVGKRIQREPLRLRDCVKPDLDAPLLSRICRGSVWVSVAILMKTAERTMNERTKPVRGRDLKAKKKRGERITMLTAYDATMARLLDRAGIDALLVGDSMGMVIMGEATTIPVTLDAMIHHTRAVTRGAKRALVVADMPFMTYQVSVAEALRNAGRLIQEGGAAAVKLEGGRGVVETTARLVEVGIPVMGHLGLTPQSVHQQGFRPQARHPEDAEELLAEARALETAGTFALVLESIPADVAAIVTGALQIPTIGIGAGPFCGRTGAGQLRRFRAVRRVRTLVVKRYANLGEDMVAATEQYITDVREGRFPRTSTPCGPCVGRQAEVSSPMADVPMADVVETAAEGAGAWSRLDDRAR